ncbi:MAG TPA: hypothetical protein VEU08_14610 [Vicinamibacterales bacterium]|nr:hypothetical protein [Vicinamibacterales bacterium]
MGGVGSGGSRIGSGRKRKNAEERRLDGNAGRRGRILPHPSASSTSTPPASLPEVDEADAPNELTADERKVWMELAPHALAKKTLTPATSLAFCLLCKNIALERRFAVSVMDAGGANHRGIIQRIQVDLAAFNLRPFGKAAVEAEEPQRSRLEQFLLGGGKR